jgi:hypothetical protein
MANDGAPSFAIPKFLLPKWRKGNAKIYFSGFDIDTYGMCAECKAY